MVASLNAALNQAAALKQSNVLAHGIEGNRKMARDLSHPRLTPTQVRQNLAARRIGQGKQGIVEFVAVVTVEHIFNLLDEYNGFLIPVKDRRTARVNGVATRRGGALPSEILI
jgi:hypothetical protein